MINDLVISQIRQRLEILYQMVDQLETGGGGGQGGVTDYDDLTSRPVLNNKTISGNRTADYYGLATSTAFNALSSTVNTLSGTIADLFASDPVTISGGDTLPAATQTRVANHEPIYFNNGEYSGQYYFIEDEGSVFTIYATVPTSGALPTITYARIERSTNKVEFYQTAVDVTPTSDSQDLITSGGVYTALQSKANVETVAGLIDAGAKNLLKNTAPYGNLVRTNLTFTHNDDDTYVVNATSANTANTDLYVAADMPIKAGTYVLSGCPAGGNNSNTYKLQIAGIGYDLGDGLTFTIAQDTTINVYIRIWNGYVPNNIVFKPMISTAADYAISSEYVPYAPSNRELYEEIEETNATVLPFLSGKKVYERYFGSSSGSDTYTATATDFGTGDLRKCGIYLIYRVSWATAPAISIYALAYSGGNTNYTTLQKIVGDDFDISVTQSVLSFTTAGKIQIIAVN